MDRFNSRIGGKEKRISEQEDRPIKTAQSEKSREKIGLKISHQDLCEYNKKSNIHVIRVLGKKRKRVGLKSTQRNNV